MSEFDAVVGSEAVVAENVVEAAEVAVPTGLAGVIAASIAALLGAQELAAKLESGLSTQAEIKRTSVALRETLFGVKNDVHSTYKSVIDIREDLLANVEVVAKAKTKESLEAQMAELQARLAAFEA